MYKPQILYSKFPSFCFGHTGKPECEIVTGKLKTGNAASKLVLCEFANVFGAGKGKGFPLQA
jgi:hypothetical protein